MLKGYVFNGTTRQSSKQGVRLRQVRVGSQIYRIRPSFVLPYMQARTDEAYIATTVGGGGFLGVDAAQKADFEYLAKAYGVFKA